MHQLNRISVLFEHRYGDIGTDFGTECASGARNLIRHDCWSVPLKINTVRHPDKLTGTGNRTEPAPFAAQYVDLDFCHGMIPLQDG
jgi:hypothetical protein